jgi:hypothetical protein
MKPSHTAREPPADEGPGDAFLNAKSTETNCYNSRATNLSCAHEGDIDDFLALLNERAPAMVSSAAVLENLLNMGTGCKLDNGGKSFHESPALGLNCPAADLFAVGAVGVTRSVGVDICGEKDMDSVVVVVEPAIPSAMLCEDPCIFPGIGYDGMHSVVVVDEPAIAFTFKDFPNTVLDGTVSCLCPGDDTETSRFNWHGPRIFSIGSDVASSCSSQSSGSHGYMSVSGGDAAAGVCVTPCDSLRDHFEAELEGLAAPGFEFDGSADAESVYGTPRANANLFPKQVKGPNKRERQRLKREQVMSNPVTSHGAASRQAEIRAELATLKVKFLSVLESVGLATYESPESRSYFSEMSDLSKQMGSLTSELEQIDCTLVPGSL